MPKPTADLPGAELVEQGLADLKAGHTSDFSILLMVAGPVSGISALKSPSVHQHAPTIICFTNGSKNASATTPILITTVSYAA